MSEKLSGEAVVSVVSGVIGAAVFVCPWPGGSTLNWIALVCLIIHGIALRRESLDALAWRGLSESPP